MIDFQLLEHALSEYFSNYAITVITDESDGEFATEGRRIITNNTESAHLAQATSNPENEIVLLTFVSNSGQSFRIKIEKDMLTPITPPEESQRAPEYLIAEYLTVRVAERTFKYKASEIDGKSLTIL